MFKQNTELIVPLIINKLHFSINCLRSVYIEELGNNKFLVIKAENVLLSEDFLLKEEPNFYSIFYAGQSVVIRYLIPNQIWYLCSILKNTGYKGLTKDLLFDCICFWKKHAFEILVNEKTQAARDEQSGFYFFNPFQFA